MLWLPGLCSCWVCRAAASMPLWPLCRGLKLPAMYTLPRLGASTMTCPLLYSTVFTLPCSKPSRGSPSSSVPSWRQHHQCNLVSSSWQHGPTSDIACKSKAACFSLLTGRKVRGFVFNLQSCQQIKNRQKQHEPL